MAPLNGLEVSAMTRKLHQSLQTLLTESMTAAVLTAEFQRSNIAKAEVVSACHGSLIYDSLVDPILHLSSTQVHLLIQFFFLIHYKFREKNLLNKDFLCTRSNTHIHSNTY